MPFYTFWIFIKIFTCKFKWVKLSFKNKITIRNYILHFFFIENKHYMTKQNIFYEHFKD